MLLKVIKVLESFIGSDESCNDLLKEKSLNYSNMLEKLAKQKRCPLRMCTNHLLTDCNTNCFFFARTTQNSDSLLKPKK